MKNLVSFDEVHAFKNNWCNENGIISHLISKKLRHRFVPPVLDVGSGLGDIPHDALPGHRVIRLDVNAVRDGEYPLCPLHTRVQGNFFDYVPDEPVGTVFICHTLQFIDDSPELLNAQINRLGPANVVTVTNDNDGFLGQLVAWAQDFFVNANPEVEVPGFPEGYVLAERVRFSAAVTCGSFDALADQMAYMLLIDLIPETREFLCDYLRRHLHAPGFEFNQSIKIYTRNGK